MTVKWESDRTRVLGLMILVLTRICWRKAIDATWWTGTDTGPEKRLSPIWT